jgi:uncharacterized protein (DUF302 family)
MTTLKIFMVLGAVLAAAFVTSSIEVKGEPAMVVQGLITVKSHDEVGETMKRLGAAVLQRGMTIFARIDHGAGAAEVGLPLRPTELLIFGSPKGGTPLMQSAQTAGIDLPLKVLVWQDAAGATWLSYNDPAWIAGRHGAESKAAVDGMSALLQSIAIFACGGK